MCKLVWHNRAEKSRRGRLRSRSENCANIGQLHTEDNDRRVGKKTSISEERSELGWLKRDADTSIHTCGNHVVSFCSEKKGF